MSQKKEGRKPRKARSAANVNFVIANPDAVPTDEAIDALARLLLSLKQTPPDQQENAAA